MAGRSVRFLDSINWYWNSWIWWCDGYDCRGFDWGVFLGIIASSSRQCHRFDGKPKRPLVLLMEMGMGT